MTDFTREYRLKHEKIFATECRRLKQKFVKGDGNPMQTLEKTEIVDFVELTSQVCKIRNASELYSFIEKLHCEAEKDRSKRQLPNTITPEGSDVRKKHLKSDGEKLKEKSPGKDNSIKNLFSESSTCAIRRTQNRKLIETLTQTPHLHSLDKIPIFCPIIVSNKEDITGKPNTQLNVLILNPSGEVIEQHDAG